jgi:hypothetical protein
MIHGRNNPRHGLASLWALVVLALLTALLASTTAQVLRTRRVLDHRKNEMQAAWLARSGLELAAGRLLADPVGYKGETVEIVPGSQVRVEVRAEGDKGDTFLVISEAQFPTKGTPTTKLSLTRRFRRFVDKDQAHLEVVAAPPAKKE